MQKKIQQKDFVFILNMISELNFTKEQLRRLADTHSEEEVKTILADISTQEQIAKGLRELVLAQKALGSGEDKVDCALLALDHINDAKVLTKKRHTRTYWRAKL